MLLLTLVPEPLRAAAQPVAAVWQVICVLPTMEIAPLFWVLKTLANGFCSAASAVTGGSTAVASTSRARARLRVQAVVTRQGAGANQRAERDDRRDLARGGMRRQPRGSRPPPTGQAKS
ncbi:hypothetical protein GCM10009714_34760 [Microlunatus capsulatus]